MAARQLSERIVDVLSVCSEDPSKWPVGLRADCSLIHARFEALKLDAGDAEAICEAVTRPTMRFVAVKSSEQQAALSMHRTRDLLVKQRTPLIT